MRVVARGVRFRRLAVVKNQDAEGGETKRDDCGTGFRISLDIAEPVRTSQRARGDRARTTIVISL